MTAEPTPIFLLSQDRRIFRIIWYVNRNPNLTRRDLARMVNLSVWYLARLFKRETGMQLNRYLQERRLQYSARLLATTDHAVKMVSFICGYRHSSSFVRAFTQRFGESPDSYRRRMTPVATEAELPVGFSA